MTINVLNVNEVPVATVSIFVIKESQPPLGVDDEVYVGKNIPRAFALIDSDSDGDGIPDSVEGFTDADRDGIPDCLDSIPECYRSGV